MSDASPDVEGIETSAPRRHTSAQSDASPDVEGIETGSNSYLPEASTMSDASPDVEGIETWATYMPTVSFLVRCIARC